jgi:farnesyl-diphosphate farnesyltransferase
MRRLRSVPPSRKDSEGAAASSSPGPSARSLPSPSNRRGPLSQAELASLLTQTSRTFALAVPLLGEPLATDVGLAYLLFRIADTLEGASAWGRDARLVALDSFGEWLVGDPDERVWLETVAAAPPTDDRGDLALLARAEAVRAAVMARGDELATSITMDVVRTSAKMAELVVRQSEDGGLTLRDLPDLEQYCYAVAGIVGELLTELLLAREPALEPARDALFDRAPAFGEGLQLVSILKDAVRDERSGRLYIPAGVSRAELTALARRDLGRAGEYLALLESAGASSGVRMFSELPVRLAEATLDRLDAGAAKLTRAEVLRIHARVTARASS